VPGAYLLSPTALEKRQLDFDPQYLFSVIDYPLVIVENDMIVECNPAFKELLGTQMDLQGRFFEEFVSRESKNGYQSLLQRHIERGDKMKMSLRLKHAEGKLIPVSLSCQVHHYGGDCEQCIYVMVPSTKGTFKQNIILQMAKAMAKVDSKSTFSTLVLSLTKILGVKYGFVGIFDEYTSRMSIISLSIDNELVDPFSYDLEETPCEIVIQGGVYTCERGVADSFPQDQLLTDWGVEGYVGVSLHDDQKKPIGHLVVMDTNPIKDGEVIAAMMQMYSGRVSSELSRRTRRKELKRSERNYRNLFESSFEAKLIYNVYEKKYVGANQAACNLFGYAKEQFYSMNFSYLKPETLSSGKEVSDEVEEIVAYVMEGNSHLAESENLRADGSVFYSEVATSLLSKEEGLLLISIRDVTRRKLAESELELYRAQLEKLVEARTEEVQDLNVDLTQVNKDLEETIASLNQQKLELELTLAQLRDAQTQLVRSEKLASVGVLAAGIAHEINNPLNYIAGGVEILKRETDLISGIPVESKEQFDQAVGFIQEGLQRSAKVVKSLTHFSHGDYKERKLANLEKLVNGTLLTRESELAGIEVKTSYELQKDVPIFPELFHQIVSLLLENAIYYARKSEQNPEIAIDISPVNDGGTAEITISNSGPCIPEDVMSRIFDPFFTTKDAGEGPGLGLAIAYAFTQRHNGEVLVKNLDPGVSFQVRLPIENYW